jgi:glyoxylase-like metal-dependent hydrolase (beta-lactamase superfamily II)
MMAEVLRRTADIATGDTRLQIGDITVHRLADADRIPWPIEAMFGNDADGLIKSAQHLLAPGALDPDGKRLLLSFNTFVIETPDFVSLVDAGLGNGKERPDRPAWHRRNGDFLQRLAALGLDPGRIDIVINTHLHADHVGWNTVLSGGAWRATFPNARYVTPRIEFAHWNARHVADPSAQILHGAFSDSILPIVEDGRMELVDLPCEVAPGLVLESAPGHTPGMAIVRLETEQGDVVILADVIHHPLQLIDPALTTRFCADAPLARTTRRRLLDECAESGAVVAAYHFPSPVFTRLVKTGAGFRAIAHEREVPSVGIRNRPHS